MTRTVIVCSYGPRKATHGSIRRLRSMLDADDQLIVYAGTRAGEAHPGKTKGVEVVEAIGRDGVLEALERATGDHVLHITDGVTITAGALGRLFAAMERTGKVVTPWTNDLGTDHYVGALPVHGNTVQVLSELGRQQQDAPVRVLRPICVGGTVKQILGLVPFHLSYPTAVLRLMYEDCLAVAGAVAAHDGSAEDRMLPPEGPEGRPLLVASMIVRDEERFLEDCLKSLEGLVDRIDLCDTGSVDRTLEIARKYGCNIIEREWRNDFGWARNEVLEQSKDAWYSLWIDADERVVVQDVERIRRELATSVDHFDGFDIPITAGFGPDAEGQDLADQDARDHSRWTTTRILKPDTMHYLGALHEQVVRREDEGPGVSAVLDGIELVHLGYASEVIESRDKTNRNLDISRDAYEAEPDNPVRALHYARSLWMARAKPEERLEPLEKAHAGFDNADARNRAFVKGLLAKTLEETGDRERAMDLAEEALDLVPSDDTAFEALWSCARSTDQTHRVLERLDAYAHGPSLRPAMEDPATRASNRAEGVRLLKEAGRVDEALTHTSQLLIESGHDFPHWELLIDGLLETRTPEEFVDEVRDLLTRATNGSWARPLATRVRRDLVLALIDEYLAGGGKGVEPVRVATTLAMLTNDVDRLRAMLTTHGDRLSGLDRKALAGRLRERGDHDSADLLAVPAEAEQRAPAFLL